MKATELLQKHHRDIEALLQRLHDAGQGDERAIRQELAAILVAHTVIEQESFYPALRDALPEEINEALEEHGLADVELARLLAVRAGDETADAKLAVLSEIVINHIRREESDILKAADRELTNDALNDLGDVMAQRFRQILDTGYGKLLQKALAEEVPRTPSRTVATKAARRAPKARATRKKKAARPAATAKRAPSRPASRRAPAKRAAGQRGQRSPSTTKTKRTRASAGTTRTRA
jgi:hemerythrin-like domain-containing protein